MKTMAASATVKGVKVQVMAGLIIAAISSSVAFAYSLQRRVTTLEASLNSIAQDLHDIKTLLLRGNEANNG